MLDQALIEQLSKQAGDILDQIEPVVHAWRTEDPQSDSINEVFRGLHTIKGGFGFFGLKNIKMLAHALEDDLSEVRSMHINLTPDHVELCIRAFARLRSLCAEPWTSDDAEIEPLFKELGFTDTESLSEDGSNEAAQWPLIPSHKQCEQAIKLSRDIFRITLRTSRDIEEQGLTLLDMNDMLTALGNPMQMATGLDDIDGLTDCLSIDLAYQVLFMTSVGVEDLALTLDIPEECIEVLNLQEFIKHEDDEPDMAIDGIEYLLHSIGHVSAELAERMEKQVKFEYDVVDVSLDAAQRLGLQACLIHLLRNALDHGIESPDDRIKHGKEATGLIQLRALAAEDRINIEIVDNGAGLDGERIVNRAIERGLIQEGAVPTEDADIFDLLFLPGFSTCDQVSEVSGRGVGMDVVKQQVRDLGGEIAVQSQLGKGSTFSLSLPLKACS